MNQPIRTVLRGLVDGFRDHLDTAKGTPAARAAIDDLQRHFDADAHLSPAQMAEYRHRLARYAKSAPHDELPFSPIGPSAA